MKSKEVLPDAGQRKIVYSPSQVTLTAEGSLLDTGDANSPLTAIAKKQYTACLGQNCQILLSAISMSSLNHQDASSETGPWTPPTQ